MTSAIPIVVHPQAILQIADQAARAQYLDPPSEYVCGVILGTTDGPKIEINSAIEVRTIKNANKVTIDREVYRTLFRHHHNIYPSEVAIGWYSCKDLSKDDLKALQEAFEAIDHADDYIRGEFLADREQPLILYSVKGDQWFPVEYSYESELAERIAMMQIQSEGNAESQVQFTADAFRSLDAQLAVIENYLNNVANGSAKFNAELVRRCADVGQWWNHKPRAEDDDSVLEQENVALLVGMLAETITLLETRDRK